MMTNFEGEADSDVNWNVKFARQLDTAAPDDEPIDKLRSVFREGEKVGGLLGQALQRLLSQIPPEDEEPEEELQGEPPWHLTPIHLFRTKNPAKFRRKQFFKPRMMHLS